MLPACRTAGDELAIPTFALTSRDVAEFTDELQEFQGLFHDCFPRSEPRAHFFDSVVYPAAAGNSDGLKTGYNGPPTPSCMGALR